jgi:hypothetical protein
MRQSIALLALVSAAGTASAQISIQVFPSPAPNAFGSPSWAGYRDTAIEGLEAGGSNIGSRSSNPTAYETGNAFQVHDFIATNYNMWQGNTGVSAPFNSELGHRMHFGLRAVAEVGTQFALEDVAFDMTSSDSGNAFGYNSGGPGGWGVYSASRVGVLRGVDGIVGTGDDTFITSGPSTQLVDALYYVGIGNADESLVNATTYSDGVTPYAYSNTPNPAVAYAESSAGFINDFGFGWSLSTTYTINGFSGTGTATLIPAPGALAALGMGGLLAARRRRA